MEQIDVCVNNAGISKDNLLLRMTPEQWDEVMNINLKSVFNMTKQVIRPMMKAKSGSIINMSSIIGMRVMQAKAVMQQVKPVLLDLQNPLHRIGKPQYTLQCHCAGLCRNRYDALFKRRGSSRNHF